MSAETTDLQDLYRSFQALNVEGGWHRRQPALWPVPRKNLVPHRWRWRDMKPVLDRAGELVSTEMAERRNLTMTNPAQGNVYPTVRTIVAAYQMMRPGETARCHRHTPNALRFVLQGRGTYTVVNGQRLDMQPGDVLLTPGWSWHAHGTEGREDCYWLDFLDVPLVHLLEPMFFEPHSAKHEETAHPTPESSLVFRADDIADRLAHAPEQLDGSTDRQIELGAPALPTLALYMQRLRAGVPTTLQRTTANSVFAVVRGSGETRIDGVTFDWEFGDVIAVPSWRPFIHRAYDEAQLFRVTDEPVMRALGFLRRSSGEA